MACARSRRAQTTEAAEWAAIAAHRVEDAFQLSEEKYCSVGAMVKLSAGLHTTFEIVPATETALVGA